MRPATHPGGSETYLFYQPTIDCHGDRFSRPWMTVQRPPDWYLPNARFWSRRWPVLSRIDTDKAMKGSPLMRLDLAEDSNQGVITIDQRNKLVVTRDVHRSPSRLEGSLPRRRRGS